MTRVSLVSALLVVAVACSDQSGVRRGDQWQHLLLGRQQRRTLGSGTTADGPVPQLVVGITAR